MYTFTNLYIIIVLEWQYLSNNGIAPYVRLLWENYIYKTAINLYEYWNPTAILSKNDTSVI